MATKYVAVDQYGVTVFLQKNPRKELMEWAGTRHADKMYHDTKDGQAEHIGYIVHGHWFRVLGLEGEKFANSR